jgi:hypothetical protein
MFPKPEDLVLLLLVFHCPAENELGCCKTLFRKMQLCEPADLLEQSFKLQETSLAVEKKRT